MNEVSIIIKCKSDPHVLETIRSIDYPAEVIVALVPDPLLKARIEAHGARVVDAPDNNVGISSQVGLNAASCEVCIMTDSDTIFGPGYIQACLKALEQNDICRGVIRFMNTPSVAGSLTVSKVRDYINNVCRPPYMPGLGLRRSFAIQLGGFDEDIRWGVDHEFATRAIAVGGQYTFMESVYIVHTPISADHDLRAAYRTGQAMRTLDIKSGKINDGFISGVFASTLRSPRYEPYFEIFHHAGLTACLHHLRWVHSFNRGYWDSEGQRSRPQDQ